MKTIEIIVSSTGESRLETNGFSGKECLQASKFLERSLGQTTSDTKTGEFYEAHAHQQQHSRTQQET